ncbi:MAG: MFS transporter, partial [Microbacterium gubbeenense]
VAMGLLVAFGPDPETRAAADDRARRARERSMELEDTGEPVTGSIPAAGRHGLFATIRRHRGVLARLGLSAASMAAVRAGRQAILPLWGLAIGLESWQISLIVGFAGAAEFSLFYASGQVMDRFGRIWATVPSQLMMGLSLLCLALTHNAGSAEIAFAVCAIIIGIGNGLSSGALMTLGSDQAPQDDPAPFLGAWRTMTDGGASATPLLVAGITAIASLPVATGVIGAIGLVGALGFMRWVPRYSPNR